VTQVAAASRGGPAKVTPELKTFLQKNGMPEDIEKELADSGVTTREQLRTVKQDTASGGAFDKLKRRLEDSGIPGATTQLERVQVGDLDREIAEVRTAAGKGSGRTTAQLTQAIKDVEALRAQVEKPRRRSSKRSGRPSQRNTRPSWTHSMGSP
jgi:ABC-type phosphate transport system auxiliary subunit